jgi:hypothetical protein
MNGKSPLLSGIVTAAVSIREANRRGIKPVALPPHSNVVLLNFSNVLLLNFPLFHLA